MPATRPVRLWRSARVQRRCGPGKGASFSAGASVRSQQCTNGSKDTFLPIFVLLSITGAVSGGLQFKFILYYYYLPRTQIRKRSEA